MPVSPYVRVLLGLTLLAFPWVFVTMVDPQSWLAPGTLGIALSLWAATVFLLVRDGAAFDERALHTTRPGGRSTAFVRSSAVLLTIPFAVALMVTVRGTWFHLGWEATLTGAAIALVLLLAITLALATGFVLSFTRSRAIRRVPWVMVALPIVAHLVIAESQKLSPWPGVRMYEAWTLKPSFSIALAAAGYGFAWWLAAKRGHWRGGLVAGGVAGLCWLLPDKETKTAALPPAAVGFRRLPVVLIEKTGEVGSAFPENSIVSGGLRDDEMLDAFLKLPGASLDKTSGEWVRAERRTEDFQISIWNSKDNAAESWQQIAWFLASRVPSRPRIPKSQYESPRELRFRKFDAGVILESWNSKEWEIRGQVRRFEHQGSFSLFAGGNQPLQPRGLVKLWPAVEIGNSLEMSYQLTVPAASRPGEGLASVQGNQVIFEDSYLLLVNRSGTLALGTSSSLSTGEASGLASAWRKQTVEFPVPPWPADELEGARVHLFTSRYVSQVRLKVPPPAGQK